MGDRRGLGLRLSEDDALILSGGFYLPVTMKRGGCAPLRTLRDYPKVAKPRRSADASDCR